MRKLLKAAALGALLAPAVLGGTAGVAAADGPAYAEHSAVATPWGAGSSHVMSGFGGWDHGERGGQRMDRGDSGPGYMAGDRYAGPDGAWAKATGSGFTPAVTRTTSTPSRRPARTAPQAASPAPTPETPAWFPAGRDREPRGPG